MIAFRHIQLIHTLLNFIAKQCDIVIFIHTTGYRNITCLCIPFHGAECCRIFHLTDFRKRNLFFFSVFVCVGKCHLSDIVQFRIRLFLCLHIDFIIFDVCGNRGCALAVCHLRTDKLIYLCNRVSVFRSFFFIHGNGKLWFHIFQTIVHIHGSLCLLHHIRHFFGKLLQRINIISFNSDGKTAAEITAVIHGRTVGFYFAVQIFRPADNFFFHIRCFDFGVLIQQDIHADAVISSTHQIHRGISTSHRSDRLDSFDF